MDVEIQDNQTRVVSVLDSGSRDDDLHVSRQHFYTLPADLTDEPSSSYIALSYVWGQQRTSIRCDDQELEVSSQLVPALRQLHRHFPDKYYWTDSISIDQQNTGEKAHQVSMMGQIFAAAETVAVWFGEDSADIYDSLHDPNLDIKDDKAASEARVALMRRLSQIPWFYRAWTFQEIRLARHAVVMLGTRVMSWSDFTARIQALRTFEPNLSTVTIRSEARSYSSFPHAPKDQFFGTLDELNAGVSADLAALLFVTWYREATVKHDKVYSLLSGALFRNGDSNNDIDDENNSRYNAGISIDYDIAWSTLCIKAARACIDTAEDLKVLKVAGMKPRWKSPLTDRWDREEFHHLLSRPSWAPDWWEPPQRMRSSASLAHDARGVFAPLSFYAANKPPPQSPSADVSPFLSLKGVLLGIVNTGDPPSWSGGPTLVHSPPRCASSGRGTWVPRPKPLTTTPSLEGVQEVHMPTFIEDVQRHLQGQCPCFPFRNNNNNPAAAPSRLSFEKAPPLHFEHTLDFALDHRAVDGGNKENEVPAQVLAASVESGDWVVLLQGGGTPFVLRPVMDRMGYAQRVAHLMTAEERQSKGDTIPVDDAGCFVLVGEASMCWDQLWPEMWDMYCRAGDFVII